MGFLQGLAVEGEGISYTVFWGLYNLALRTEVWQIFHAFFLKYSQHEPTAFSLLTELARKHGEKIKQFPHNAFRNFDTHI